MKTTIYVEREVEVEFTYHKGSKGHCDKYGAPEEPDEDPEMEFITATTNGVEIALTDDEIVFAEAQALQEMIDEEGPQD